MRKLGLLWKSLVTCCVADDCVTPMIIKKLFIMKWCKAFEDHIYLCVVVRRTSIPYTIRHDVTYAFMCPPLKTDVLFSKE